MKINFYLKNPGQSRNENKESLILLFVSIYGQRLKLSLKISVHPQKWDFSKQQVRKSHKSSPEINAYLNKIRMKVYKAYYDDLMKDDHSFESLKRAIKKGLFKQDDKNAACLLNIYEEYILSRKPEVARSTLQRFNILYNHLKTYENLYRQRLTFEKIGLAFFDEFKLYLLKDAKITNRTLAIYIKNLKTFLNWCVAHGYTENLSFRDFKFNAKGKTKIVYLTLDELKSLYLLDLSFNKKLDKVRDVFCFGCFTGQRFSDIRDIHRQDIRGNTWHLYTQKTRDFIQIPLTNLSMTILEKYKNEIVPLPIMSNAYTNRLIKEVCKLAEIDEDTLIVRFQGAKRIDISGPKYQFITTHTARRTFVTLSLEAGMTNAEVMAITGHKDLKSLQAYAGYNKISIHSKMNQVWEQL
ncbi:hypothetical protein BKI52_41925 [marine bacterium AO1-C]|nr:hypothetical protein BKI52_41925 [marine bacterium AO1-C]